MSFGNKITIKVDAILKKKIIQTTQSFPLADDSIIRIARVSKIQLT